MPVHNSQELKDKPLVVGVTGRIGAGKTSVSKYLSEVHGFYYVRYSQVLSEWRAENPDSKKHLQEVGWEVMEGGMQLELNARLIAQIPPQLECAVDGLRHPTDFDSLSRLHARNAVAKTALALSRIWGFRPCRLASGRTANWESSRQGIRGDNKRRLLAGPVLQNRQTA
jgi:hypothetical protein